MALTATADLDSRAIIKRQLHLENATEVSISPNRTNIRLGLKTVSSNGLDCLDWLVKELKALGPSMSHTIIYCQTLKAVGKVFCYLKAELGEDCWVNRDPEHKAENSLIGIFHSQTLPHNKARVLNSFGGDGVCRVVVATTALGMGLNFPQVSHVIMYGVPEDVEAILQEVGRAGRDGSFAHAIIYRVKTQTRTDEVVKTLLEKSSNSCFRKALFAHFEHCTESVKPGHLCCTYCHSVCICTSTGCDVATPEFERSQLEVHVSDRSTEVTEDDKALIRDLFCKYRMSLVPDTHLYTDSTHCTGFSTDLINCVLVHCTQIFDLNYIMDNLPVFSKEHAQGILRVLFEDFPHTELDKSLGDFLVPDQDFIGYFDEEDTDQNTLSTSSSAESGLSLLKSSD